MSDADISTHTHISNSDRRNWAVLIRYIRLRCEMLHSVSTSPSGASPTAVRHCEHGQRRKNSLPPYDDDSLVCPPPYYSALALGSSVHASRETVWTPSLERKWAAAKGINEDEAFKAARLARLLEVERRMDEELRKLGF
ncbi:hypothetical protein MNV49_004259 [Pseudohyphozyma bogoriensis]|nr:hypothetical protein MNV49_004259 [Pseudohyphozyma bogoriensis]